MGIDIYSIVPSAPCPVKAKIQSHDWLPQRATKFCIPVIEASNDGFYIYPPIDLDIKSNPEGFTILHPETSDVVTTLGDDTDTYLPSCFVNELVDSTPRAQLALPPFLTRLQEKNIVQIWTGHMVKSDPGIGVLVRPLVNAPTTPGIRCLEGFIETDWWSGPLLSNFIFEYSDAVLQLRLSRPIIQVQFFRTDRNYDDQVICHAWDESHLSRFLSGCMQIEQPTAEHRLSYAMRRRKAHSEFNNSK